MKWLALLGLSMDLTSSNFGFLWIILINFIKIVIKYGMEKKKEKIVLNIWIL